MEVTAEYTSTWTEHRSPSLRPALLIEGLFSAVVLFVGTGAVFPLLRRLGGEGTVTVNAGGPEGKIYALALLITLVLLARVRRELFAIVRSDIVLWALPLIALVSTAWSSDPSATMRSAVALLGSMLFGAYLAMRFGAEGQLRILAVTLAITIALSIASVGIEPYIGVDQGMHSGAWRGVFGHKNLFGRVMAFAFCVYAVLCGYSRNARPLAIVFCGLSLAMAWMSTSRTALVTIVAMLLYFAARPLLRRWKIRSWMVASVLATVLIALGLLSWSQRLTLLQGGGGTETLTGRTLLWIASVVKVAEHPAIGYGYSAFWGGMSGDYLDVWRIVNWSVPNAHNAFLDVALDLGLVGFGVFCWTCVRTWTRTLALQRAAELTTLERIWPGAVITFTMVAYMTEGQLLYNHAYWMLFTAAAVQATHHQHRQCDVRP